MILFFIILLAFLLRLYKLDSIPGDIWGDINTHFELTQRILNGNFYFNYDFGGDGPMISYLIGIVSKVFGLTFFTIKLTTVLIDVLSVYVLYLLAMELFKNRNLAYLSSFLMSVSFWNISLSRQGKPYILVPLFVMLMILFLLKRRNITAGIFLGLGMYTQASFWGMAFFAFFNPITFIFSLIVGMPFFYETVSNFNSYFNENAYIGEKMGLSLSINEKIVRLGENIIKNIMSFNFKGDLVYRHNISGYPHLDTISGILFCIGIVFLLIIIWKRKNIRLVKFFFLPFIFAQIPSILDINNVSNVPNLGRMAGVTPFVYIAIAYILSKFYKRWKVFTLILLLLIALLNFRNYFYVFPVGLPNQNIAFAKIIASDMDKQNQDALVGMVGCCWDESGQPEWTSISNLVQIRKKVAFFNQAEEDSPKLTCDILKNKRFVLYLDPKDKNTVQLLKQCNIKLSTKLIKVKGRNVTTVLNSKDVKK